MNADERLLEAALFAAEAPMTADELAEATGIDAPAPALHRLARHYAGRGVELVELGGRWSFRTAADLGHILRRTRPEPRRLSRAAIETLAIVAYHQPVSRAEIEAIRGVAVARGTLDTLMEAAWVAPAGRREVPGRPLTYATTDAFLDHFGLADLADLPGLAELRATGLLDREAADAGEVAKAGDGD